MDQRDWPTWAKIAAVGGEWFFAEHILDASPKPGEEYIVKHPLSWVMPQNEGWFFYEPPSVRMYGWEESPEKSHECCFVWGKVLSTSEEGLLGSLRIRASRIVDLEMLAALPSTQPEAELFCGFIQDILGKADEYIAAYIYRGYHVIVVHVGQASYCVVLVYVLQDAQRFLLLQSDESSGGNFYFAGKRVLSEQENIFLTTLEAKAQPAS